MIGRIFGEKLPVPNPMFFLTDVTRDKIQTQSPHCDATNYPYVSTWTFYLRRINTIPTTASTKRTILLCPIDSAYTTVFISPPLAWQATLLSSFRRILHSTRLIRRACIAAYVIAVNSSTLNFVQIHVVGTCLVSNPDVELPLLACTGCQVLWIKPFLAPPHCQSYRLNIINRFRWYSKTNNSM